MTLTHRYLQKLSDEQRARLTEINRPGLAALRLHLSSDRAVAFLGAGTSVPLYPLWQGVIVELIDAARDELSDQVAGTCQAMAVTNPDAVVELVRRHLIWSDGGFRGLRCALRTGKTQSEGYAGCLVVSAGIFRPCVMYDVSLRKRLGREGGT